MTAAEYKTIRRALRASVGAAAFDAWIAEYTTRVTRDTRTKAFTDGQRDVYWQISNRLIALQSPLHNAAWSHVFGVLSNELPASVVDPLWRPQPDATNPV